MKNKLKYTFVFAFFFLSGKDSWADQIIFPGESVIAHQDERISCIANNGNTPINAYCSCDTEFDGQVGYRLVKGIHGDNATRVNIVRSITSIECGNLLNSREVCGQYALRETVYKSCDREMDGRTGYRLVSGMLTNATPRVNIMRNLTKENCIEFLKN